MRRGWLVLALLGIPAIAGAERPGGVCIEVGVDFVPAESMQIVAWLEDEAGAYQETLYITQKTGRFGMGNRPGRRDFNTGSASGDTFPYGRRDQTFPVWAHRHGESFPLLVFQNGDENNLSHPFGHSSPEVPPPYCRPIQPTEVEFDTGSCASETYTDKGVFAPDGATSKYPPRSDLAPHIHDSASVAQFREMNPFDTISRATPVGGVPLTITWAAPQSYGFGNYVLYVEASKTYDFNDTYNPTTYPAPTMIPWADYGKPWRGQPSIVYRVPFSIAMTETRATTTDYVGYGDPTGQTGTLNPPDATITTDTPGSGASRMQLVADGNEMYRVRVRTRPEYDSTAPAPVDATTMTKVGSTSATIEFIASGDDGMEGTVAGYEIRVRAGSQMTAANFGDSMSLSTAVVPAAAGSTQIVELTGLLPETEYYVGIVPYDNCFNRGELTVKKFTTQFREVPAVDWCFVATAAYGSTMANDVAMLRRFRDTLLAQTVFGELAKQTYYTFSPAVAGVVGQSELLRASARAVLVPIIAWVRNLAF